MNIFFVNVWVNILWHLCIHIFSLFLQISLPIIYLTFSVNASNYMKGCWAFEYIFEGVLADIYPFNMLDPPTNQIKTIAITKMC